MSDPSLDYITETYGDGDCGIFARAVAYLTGLPVVLFRLRGAHADHLPDRWPRHAAVALGDGLFLDASGAATPGDVAERFGCRMFVDCRPDDRAYPFQSAPGGVYFDEESWQDACAAALEMMLRRGHSDIVDASVAERVLGGDVEGRLEAVMATHQLANL
ncbi:hypothetical protein G6L37_01185 [Agrobacterium rubi]|nr:hypothetical protein [Agrobacterium rubi]NTF24005.1 hypothetical protein [Agrobacterium rubi]